MGTTEHMVMVLFTLKKIILKSLLKVEAHAPWRTQDFRGEATPEVVAPTYYFSQFCPKTAWKWKKKWTGRGAAVLAIPLDPPMKANKIYKLEML